MEGVAHKDHTASIAMRKHFQKAIFIAGLREELRTAILVDEDARKTLLSAKQAAQKKKYVEESKKHLPLFPVEARPVPSAPPYGGGRAEVPDHTGAHRGSRTLPVVRAGRKGSLETGIPKKDSTGGAGKPSGSTQTTDTRSSDVNPGDRSDKHSGSTGDRGRTKTGNTRSSLQTLSLGQKYAKGDTSIVPSITNRGRSHRN
jgi:hypothetical protein